MDNVVAVVFCGGEGTRLRPLSYLIRKEMLPIGRRRKPVLEFIVNHLRRNGIREIIFLGSKASEGEIRNYFGKDGHRFGVNIRYQPDPKNCSGTGHALLWAIKENELEGKELLIYYGDVLNTTNLQELLLDHLSKKAAATLVLSEKYVIPKGVAKVGKNGFVKEFIEKPHWKGSGRIGIGLLCLNSASLVRACEGKLPSTEDELQKSEFRDVMRNIVTFLIKYDRVAAFTTTAPWIDIGSFDDYAKVNDDIDWLIGESEDTLLMDRELSVFISYHINDENCKLIEELVIPCLNAAGIRTVSGGTLDRDHKVNMSPLHIAEHEIEQSDEIIAFATPDSADKSPSEYVKHEVAYARGRGKHVSLFVEKGTNVPDPMSKGITWTNFDKAKPGELIRDVLQKFAKSR